MYDPLLCLNLTGCGSLRCAITVTPLRSDLLVPIEGVATSTITEG
jgi:hypothetical protein